ncbi:hypothetical protein ACWD25_17660 [Streptomyces sp. NPDC002920]
MVDLRMDSFVYIATAVASLRPRHNHLLVKDPFRLGWHCEVAGCRFFKPAEEFDRVRTTP